LLPPKVDFEAEAEVVVVDTQMTSRVALSGYSHCTREVLKNAVAGATDVVVLDLQDSAEVTQECSVVANSDWQTPRLTVREVAEA